MRWLKFHGRYLNLDHVTDVITGSDRHGPTAEVFLAAPAGDWSDEQHPATEAREIMLTGDDARRLLEVLDALARTFDLVQVWNPPSTLPPDDPEDDRD